MHRMEVAHLSTLNNSHIQEARKVKDLRFFLFFVRLFNGASSWKVGNCLFRQAE